MRTLSIIFISFYLFQSFPKYLPSNEILLPKTCHFINDYSMQEINTVCQKRGEKEFFECIGWMKELDYDVCDDYNDIWMEEFQENSTYINIFF